jgi:hypothetical protein
MMTTTLCVLFTVLAFALVALEVIGRLGEARPDTIRRLSGYGMSQRVIADRLCCSRWQVRKALA